MAAGAGRGRATNQGRTERAWRGAHLAAAVAGSLARADGPDPGGTARQRGSAGGGSGGEDGGGCGIRNRPNGNRE